MKICGGSVNFKILIFSFTFFYQYIKGLYWYHANKTLFYIASTWPTNLIIFVLWFGSSVSHKVKCSFRDVSITCTVISDVLLSKSVFLCKEGVQKFRLWPQSISFFMISVNEWAARKLWLILSVWDVNT